MTDIVVKHAFVSAKADGPDTTLIRPSNWNAEHPIELSGPGVVGRATAGAGPAELLPLYSLLPTGVFFPFAGTVLPSGFLYADGSVLLRADFQALFTVIGTAFNTGGELGTQFRLPDLRGRVPAGLDNMNGSVSLNRLYPTINSGLMGSTGGEQTHVLSIAEMPAHNHLAGDYGHSHSIPQAGLTGNNSGLGGSGGGSSLWQNSSVATWTDGAYANIWIANQGGSGAHNNVQPTIVVNYIIKY